jgi:hypothetical protein
VLLLAVLKEVSSEGGKVISADLYGKRRKREETHPMNLAMVNELTCF